MIVLMGKEHAGKLVCWVLNKNRWLWNMHACMVIYKYKIKFINQLYCEDREFSHLWQRTSLSGMQMSLIFCLFVSTRLYRYFVFQGTYYQHVFGTAMESSASTPVRLSFRKPLRFVAIYIWNHLLLQHLLLSCPFNSQ